MSSPKILTRLTDFVHVSWFKVSVKKTKTETKYSAISPNHTFFHNRFESSIIENKLESVNSLSANPTKWSNTLKQFHIFTNLISQLSVV